MLAVHIGPKYDVTGNLEKLHNFQADSAPDTVELV
jgi:hypothetical protein